MPKPRPTTQHSRVSSIPTSSSSSQLTAPAALQIPASASDSDPYDPLQPNPACSGLTMQAYHHHTNPALTLPTINFNFDELREQMSRFTLQFDEFIEKGRRRLLEEKNEFARNIAHNHERARETKSQIEYYKEKEVELSEQIRREEEEATEARNTIATMTRKHITISTHKTQLETLINSLESQVQSRRALKLKQRTILSQHSSINTPELSFWEDNLGMRIEGAGVPDHLKILFTHVDERDWEREFSFVVNMEKRDYQVVWCRPGLDQPVVAKAVERLNETRNFGGFLKEMRIGFMEYVKSSVGG